MIYLAEEKIEPFWAQYSSEASGRDPLAIQNSSVVIYTKMVVGITNVTNRIRYNGFFCLILATILSKIKKTNSRVEQIRYLRRAELLLAYIMVKNYPETTGVSGSAFASKNLNSLMSLKDGADWESKTEKGLALYWKFREGIFGQYYKGVVSELNLINHPSDNLNIYTLNHDGVELAEAFGNNIPENESTLFWESVFKGKVVESDLSKLTSFALHIIPANSGEVNFYERVLLSHDDRKLIPSFNRQQTIKLMMGYLKKQSAGIENLPSAFLRDNYLTHIKFKQLENNTASAWYLFEMNELLHIAIEHFHACFLYSIGSYPTLLTDAVESLKLDTEKSFKEEKINTKTNTLRQLSNKNAEIDADVYSYYDSMETAFKERNFGLCLAQSIQTIVTVYNNVRNQITQLQDFAFLPEYKFNRTGYAVELLHDLVESRLDMSINEYTESLILQVINLHTFSSYGKTRIGQSLVNNYMIEDELVWRMRETNIGRTSPRLQNVVQYIIDIGWLKKETKKVFITERGLKVLEGL